MIERVDFRNQNNMIHNNVGDNVLAEHITEYTIHMDSVDRDISLYYNQFKFTVHFGDTTEPNIERRFKNIKYIKLENVILPTSSAIDLSGNDASGTSMDASGNVYSSRYILTDQRYILLKIKELANDRVLSTGNIVKSDTVKLYYDVTLNSYYSSWTTNQNSFVYTNANLGNVKRLSFELYDSNGNQILMFTSNDNGLSGPQLNYNTFYTFDASGNITGEVVAENNLNHPLNQNTQMAVTLIFGVVENEVNTNTQYDS